MAAINASLGRLADPTDLDQLQAQALQPVDDAVQGRLIRDRAAHDGTHRDDLHGEVPNLVEHRGRQFPGHADLVLERRHAYLPHRVASRHPAMFITANTDREGSLDVRGQAPAIPIVSRFGRGPRHPDGMVEPPVRTWGECRSGRISLSVHQDGDRPLYARPDRRRWTPPRPDGRECGIRFGVRQGYEGDGVCRRPRACEPQPRPWCRRRPRAYGGPAWTPCSIEGSITPSP